MRRVSVRCEFNEQNAPEFGEIGLNLAQLSEMVQEEPKRVVEIERRVRNVLSEQ